MTHALLLRATTCGHVLRDTSRKLLLVVIADSVLIAFPLPTAALHPCDRGHRIE